MIYQIAFEKLDLLLGALSRNETVYLPVDNAQGEADFERYEAGKKLSTRLNTRRSAKDFFFPQIQPLVKFRRE